MTSAEQMYSLFKAVEYVVKNKKTAQNQNMKVVFNIKKLCFIKNHKENI